MFHTLLLQVKIVQNLIYPSGLIYTSNSKTQTKPFVTHFFAKTSLVPEHWLADLNLFPHQQGFFDQIIPLLLGPWTAAVSPTGIHI